MNSNNITTIIIAVIIVIGGGYFLTMNMGWNAMNRMMDDNHNHEDHLHDEDIVDKTQIDTISQVVVDGPKISVDRTLHKFGVIPQYGGTVETTFIVKNEGTETLEIGDLTTSCSCTSASISSNKILVGGEAILTVVFDPDFHDEPLNVFKRTVFIPTNDANNPEMEIAIEIDIEEGK